MAHPTPHRMTGGQGPNSEPEKCWVGDKQKVCYPDEDTAEMAARLVEIEHGLSANSLSCYKCEFGNHWHLANNK